MQNLKNDKKEVSIKNKKCIFKIIWKSEANDFFCIVKKYSSNIGKIKNKSFDSVKKIIFFKQSFRSEHFISPTGANCMLLFCEKSLRQLLSALSL